MTIAPTGPTGGHTTGVAVPIERVDGTSHRLRWSAVFAGLAAATFGTSRTARE